MRLPNKLQFAHRTNIDGTFDSICLTCFMTVAHADVEEELNSSEYVHLCDLDCLERLRAISDRLQTLA